MSSQGPLGTTSAVDDASVGSVAWNNLNLTYVHDGNFATATLAVGDVSHIARATAFGFSIPSAATILGITVYNWCQSASLSGVADFSVQLYVGGVFIGDDKANPGIPWPMYGFDTFLSYGGTADLWGLTPTPADVNASNFGVGIAAKSYAGTGILGGIAYIDYIAITITFSSANQVKQQTIVARPPFAAYDLFLNPD